MVTAITCGYAIPVRINILLRRIMAAVKIVTGDEKKSEERLRQIYDETVREYLPMIERICFGYSGSVSDLEDLKQDALLNLWQSMPAFRGNCSMKTWVYRLTLNSCVTSLRKSYRRMNTVELTELYDTIDADQEHKRTIAELHEAIGSLNPLDKAIMMLWLEDGTYDEIAEITGLKKATVATRIYRAKEKLKTIFKK